VILSVAGGLSIGKVSSGLRLLNLLSNFLYKKVVFYCNLFMSFSFLFFILFFVVILVKVIGKFLYSFGKILE